MILVVLVRLYSFAAPTKVFIGKRSYRLLLPWAFWFFAYGTINLIAQRPLLPSHGDMFSNIMSGPWIGLWYLPFAFIVSLLVFLAPNKELRAFRWVILWTYLLLGTGILLAAQSMRADWDLRAPWAQWIHASAAIPFGFAIALVMRHRFSWLAPFTICIAPFFFAAATGYADPGLALTYMIAVPATTIAFVSKPIPSKTVTNLGKLVMGVYLLHGAVISAVKIALGTGTPPYVIYFLSVIASFSTTFVLRKAPFFRAVL